MVLALQAAGFTGPEALRAAEVEPGEPGPNRVRIAVRFAGVDPADAKLLRGAFGRTRSALALVESGGAGGTVVPR